jgi:hypothetical protein
MTSSRAVTCRAQDGVAWITLNRAAMLNALDIELAADLADFSEAVAADPDVQESLHRDPRARIEDVLRAQEDCMPSWDTGEANRPWQDKREAGYYPRPGAGHQHGQ